MGFRRVNCFISMKGDERSWLLYQVSHSFMCISWLLLLPVALSCGAGENLGILMVLKHGTTVPCISAFIGVKPFWRRPRYLPCSLLLLLKIAESVCPSPAQLALTTPLPQRKRSQPRTAARLSVLPPDPVVLGGARPLCVSPWLQLSLFVQPWVIFHFPDLLHAIN